MTKDAPVALTAQKIPRAREVVTQESQTKSKGEEYIVI